MFTGIIEAVGQIKQVEQRDKGVRLTIASERLDFSDVAVGDSIAANGVCLTVTALAGNAYTVDVSQESLNCTVGLSEPGEVNLEKAMRLSDRLGGHLVSGHVDGVGEVVKFEPVGESYLLQIRASRELARYIAAKGSIAINGVSLTVNEIRDGVFSINLIPHTVEVTTLKHLQPGARVNLEVDMLARYVDRLLHPDN
ncbi:riboflavin synthase [Sulfuricella sp.]|uniref:riboflavin synthase n=1 Tax=Sulfuricella sp. TaxID=2099377 RepID=UPI002CB632BE|nr:riboflavin synthase [Sulfuricella sp.]HUX64643.1 riboflavin synthase [Sulfuricella sp.]